MSYISSMLKNLIDREYRFIGLSDGGDIVKDTTAFGICVKAVPPVLYVVSVINTEIITPEQFEAHSLNFLGKIRANKEKMNCSFVVDVNILSGENADFSEFLNSKDYDPSAENHSIWWAADTASKTVSVGKNMPSNIADLRKICEASFDKKTEETMTEMERNALAAAEGMKKTRKHTVTYVLIAATILAYFFTLVFGGEQHWAYLLGNDHSRIVLYGEYYRLITCMFVHAGIFHIGYNCISLYVFGTRAEEYLGHTGFLVMYFGAGLCGSILSFLFTQGLSVGASGAVYGAVGAVLGMSLLLKKSIGGLNYMAMLVFVVAGLGMGALGGNVDNFAHIGGFIFGLLFAVIFKKLTKTEEN